MSKKKYNKKIGLDIHGVVDSDFKLFSELTNSLGNKYKFHIITGTKIDRYVLQQLNDNNILYDKIFSILDYHNMIGTRTWYEQKGWWIPEEEWDRTKGQYCLMNNITFHLDDTIEYGKYFRTPFAIYEKENNNVHIDNLAVVPKELLDFFNIIEDSYPI